MLEPIKFSVEGIGDFTARHRTMGLQIQIERAYIESCGGDPEKAPESLQNIAAMKSQLDNLLESAPKDWSAETAPLYDCSAVYLELRAAEARFLEGLEKARQGKGQSAK